MNILINSQDGLIGDFLGQIPVFQELAKDNFVTVKIHPEAEKLLKIIPKNPNLTFEFKEDQEHDKIITLKGADIFSEAARNNWYMTVGFFHQAGLPHPKVAPKAILDFDPNADKSYKAETYWVLSPFARSLPEHEKWPREKWQELVDSLPNENFIVFGNSVHNPKNFISGVNVEDKYNQPFDVVCSLLKRSKGLIGVITGTSHLAFHLSVKNIVLNNQNFSWGSNPDGIHIKTDISKLSVKEVRDLLL